MKKLLVILFFAIIGIFTIFLGGDRNRQSVVLDKNINLPDRKYSLWKDFFPMDIGTTWTYSVKIGIDPLYASSVAFPRGISWEKRYERGSMFLETGTPSLTSGILKLKAVKPVTREDPRVIIASGVRIAILQDDASLFSYGIKLYFAIFDSIDYFAGWIVTYPLPEYDWMKPDFDTRRSFCPRFLMFGGWSGDSICFPDLPGEQITYVNDREESLLHYHRVVRSQKSLPKIINQYENKRSQGPFTEDYYLMKGIGLIRLVQRVDGEISMEWTLKELSKK